MLQQLVHSLMFRKPFRLEILSCRPDKPSQAAGEIEQLLQLTSSLPSLLHQADMAVASNRSILRLRSIAHRLQTLDKRLVKWFQDFQAIEAHRIEDPNTTFGLSKGPPSRDLPIPLLNPPFRDELNLRSHHAANVHTMYWQCLLLLRMTMQNLGRLINSHKDVDTPVAFGGRDLKEEARACANLLCRSIPFLLRYAGGNVSQAASVRLPIHFAKAFFSSRAECAAELEWCNIAEEVLKGRFEALQWEWLVPWGFLAIMWQPFEAPRKSVMILEKST